MKAAGLVADGAVTVGRFSARAVVGPIAIVALCLAIWIAPVPDGVKPQAWHLFAIFVSTIVAVVADVLPILTVSVLAVAIAVLTGTLAPEAAYSGFANGTILLIVIAFLVARAVVKCGLAQRIGYVVVSVFGRSTLGLSYSVFLVDGLIAPAFPSNTARAGVLYPLAFSLAEAAGASPDQPSRRRLGAFLMFSGIASLSVSSALWLTAMAANPLGAEIARPFGVQITFASWLIAASAPTLVAMAILPLLLYKLLSPEVTSTPHAPTAARKNLAALGPLSRAERIVTITFVGMVLLWAASAPLGLDSTAIAFLGLATLLATGVLTLDDIKSQGDVLGIYIWFAVLFALSSQLNELGFMGFVGQRLAIRLDDYPPAIVGLVLILAYIALHYLFVSQTAHLLALFGVFLEVGVRLGVAPAILAFQMLFATNFFASITPQGSSANLLFAGSGYLAQGEMYRIGAICTVACLLVYVLVGVPWLWLVAR